MSTILIDRRTAVLLGELAATSPRPAARRAPAASARPAVAAASPAPEAAGPGSARRDAPATRRARRPTGPDPRGTAPVTVRAVLAPEARLRRRLRCRPGVDAVRARPTAPRSRSVPTPRGGAAPSLHLTRRGRLVVLLVFLAVLTAAFSVGRVTSTAAGDPSAADAAVVVQQGETLWSIAERIEPDADPRAVVAELMAVNGLGSPSLEAGQRLRLP